jgi:YD repeat-containing protein
LALLIGIIFPCTGMAQQSFGGEKKVYPPSPNAASLGKFGDMPVSTYTGLPNVSVPLYTIATKSHTLNLSLSYHASGIRVDEDASWVGLGWALNAGGTITRSVRGLDDLGGQGYKDSPELPPSGGSYYSPQGNHQQYENAFGGMCAGAVDTQPDVFYFNFAGRSGKFMVDRNIPGSSAANVRLLSLSDNLGIRLFYSASGQPQWEVMTEEGYRYTFSALETTGPSWREPGTPTSYISAWYLTQIEAPDGELVTLHYVANGNRTEAALSYFARSFLYGASTPNSSFQAIAGGRVESSQMTNSNSTQGVLLDSISFATGSVAFTRARRLDQLPSRAPVRAPLCITGLVVRRSAAGGGGVVRRIRFQQSYFNDDLNLAPSVATLWYRLRLDGMEESNGSERVPAYAFTYYAGPDRLPVKTSSNKDHLGYFNGASNSATALPTVTYIHPYTQQPVTIPGSDREPNADYAVTATLQRITYPTGGYTEFEYEGHTYLNDAGRDTLGCGIRLRRMTSTTLSAAPHVQRYLYTLLYARPGVTLSSGVEMSHARYVDIWAEPQYPDYGIYWLDRMANSTVPLGSGAQGQGIGYSAVTVLDGENGENGKTEYEYENAPEVQYGPFLPGVPNNVRPTNGLLTLQTIYQWRDHEFVPVKSIQDSYMTTEEEALRSCAYRQAMCNPLNVSGIPQLIDYEYYLNTTRFYTTTIYWNRLVDRSEMTFSTQEPRQGIRHLTHYDYNLAHRQVSCVTITGDGKTEKTYSLYPLDYSLPVGPIHDMATTRRQLTTVVERYSTTVRDGQEYVTAGEYTHFDYAGPQHVVVPVQVDRLELAVPVPVRLFSVSTAAGAPDSRYQAARYLQYIPNTTALRGEKRAHGSWTAYRWGLGNQQPLVECRNASYTQIAYTSFEASATGRWQYDSLGSHYVSLPLTGARAYQLDGTAAAAVRCLGLPAGAYEVQVWGNGANPPVLTGAISQHYDLVATAGQWRQHRFRLTVGANAVVQLDAGQAPLVIDELRLHPVGAQMTSYTYDPLVGMTSQTDPSGRTTTYEYDAVGRLVRTRDEQGRILSQQQYHYAGQQ